MKLIIPLILLLFLMPTLSVAGSLGKYSDGDEGQSKQAVTIDVVDKKLDQKINEAIAVINDIPLTKRAKLKARYTKKVKNALENGSRLEAAYYQGIVEGVDWEGVE